MSMPTLIRRKSDDSTHLNLFEFERFVKYMFRFMANNSGLESPKVPDFMLMHVDLRCAFRCKNHLIAHP